MLGVPSAGNVPGGRMDASAWLDESGNLWLFGVSTQDAATHKFSALNDLWEFNIPTAGELVTYLSPENSVWTPAL
jgi:hypothetical protein